MRLGHCELMMTLNQLPTLATRLMQATYSARSVTRQPYQTAPPHAIDAESTNTGSYTAAAFATALKKRLQQRRGKPYAEFNATAPTTEDAHSSAPSSATVAPVSGVTRHTDPSSNSASVQWQPALEESHRQDAAALSAIHQTEPVEAVISMLREEALFIQLMILRECRDKGHMPSPTLFSQLDKVQQVLQREVEAKAQRLKATRTATERSGNLLDEQG